MYHAKLVTPKFCHDSLSYNEIVQDSNVFVYPKLIIVSSFSGSDYN